MRNNRYLHSFGRPDLMEDMIKWQKDNREPMAQFSIIFSDSRSSALFRRGVENIMDGLRALLELFESDNNILTMMEADTLNERIIIPLDIIKNRYGKNIIIFFYEGQDYNAFSMLSPVINIIIKQLNGQEIDIQSWQQSQNDVRKIERELTGSQITRGVIYSFALFDVANEEKEENKICEVYISNQNKDKQILYFHDLFNNISRQIPKRDRWRYDCIERKGIVADSLLKTSPE